MNPLQRLPRKIVYTFFRKDGWYPLEFESDEEAIKNAELNPGTLAVVNEYTEQGIWHHENPPKAS